MTYTVKLGAVIQARGLTLEQFVSKFDLAHCSLAKAKAYRLYAE